jgi:beta-phosphoglucomutase-like phosphatase (HAD superfamily)
MPGSLALIRRARALGWYVAIVSRARRLRLHGTLEIMQMPALFDLVLGCEDSVDPLTDRKDYARAARIFGAAPARCVVIEDSASGVADARAAGIGHVIGLTSSLDAQALCAAGAHEVVAHLDGVELTL